METWAISIRQPFAYFIIYAGKDVENRTWSPKGIKKGDDLVIVASKKWHEYYYNGVRNWKGVTSRLRQSGVDTKGIRPIDFVEGGIVGVVTFNGVVENSPSEWAEVGQRHWLFSNPRPMPFIRIKGRLGIYRIDL